MSIKVGYSYPQAMKFFEAISELKNNEAFIGSAEHVTGSGQIGKYPRHQLIVTIELPYTYDSVANTIRDLANEKADRAAAYHKNNVTTP